MEVNTYFTKAIVASEWTLPTPRISTWKNLCIQRWNCWSFIQKLHFIQIGSCHFRYHWNTDFLYKLNMTIWNLWQYQNDVLLPANNGLAAVARLLPKNPLLLSIFFFFLGPLQLSFLSFLSHLHPTFYSVFCHSWSTDGCTPSMGDDRREFKPVITT